MSGGKVSETEVGQSFLYKGIIEIGVKFYKQSRKQILKQRWMGVRSEAKVDGNKVPETKVDDNKVFTTKLAEFNRTQKILVGILTEF